jgi:MoaA/NifB/PqqE/SkfB family radical SAM enzyme
MTTRLRRTARHVHRKLREARMFARAMHSPYHPILAQIIPIRRCNLSCTYCNEYDKTSEPVPADVMIRRIDRLADLGTTIITFSGGEPTLHPDLPALVRRVRDRGAVATLITNGYLLTPAYIATLNAAGLDYLQISIDNVDPDEASKKSLKVLDRKLEMLAGHAEFAVTINSVLGSPVRHPRDAYDIGVRAGNLGFTSTVGILHDGDGQLAPLEPSHLDVYRRLRSRNNGLFSFAHLDFFQENIVRGRPNHWHCRAGGRFLYVCEDGLVHYCSQQRGRPGIPIEDYTADDLRREAATPKACAPLCTVTCVHQTSILDSFREKPHETLEGILERRKEREPGFRPPALVHALSWMFLHPARKRFFNRIALRLFGLKEQ